ncbi:MAG: molybdenum cofactor guanylyltransferase MobA [Hyphomicrobiaceae bacterium]|nr:molybdenum cofactor guanylyltransferase MobA [Hyphomicrobiaceae bacterium]
MGETSANRSDPVVGVLLAGGQARRMGGGDKCMLELAGKPLLEHVIERLEPQTDTLVLNANDDPARFAAFGRPVVADPVDGFAGPLAGVLAGFVWARENVPQARWIVTAATDTPFFPLDLVSCFMSATDGSYPAIALAASRGRIHPVFGLWPTALADDLHQAVMGGTRKVLDWTDRHTTVTAEFSDTHIGGSDLDPFFNANRPEDLAHAEALLAEDVPT